MRVTPRMRRLSRKGQKPASLTLTSLMDVFTNLVFFLLMSQSASDLDEPPRDIRLPDSYVETRPQPTVNILVSDAQISIQGQPTVLTSEVLAVQGDVILPVRDELARIKATSLGLTAKSIERSNEVTILAHSEIPFKVLKKVMSSCTSAGYSKISLAVHQKSGIAPTK